MTRLSRSPLLLFACILAGACSPDSDRTVLGIDASGALAGLIYIDRNGDGAFTPATDAAATGVSFTVLRGVGDTVATGSTDATGVGIIPLVPVGSYRVVVDLVQLGDSLSAAPAEASALVQADDTAAVLVALQHPARLVREARTATAGKLIAVQGVALNAWTTFGDSTVHIADSTGVIRAVRVRAAEIAAGDSVRVVGRAGSVQGDAVISEATVFVRSSGSEPAAEHLSTGGAASARGGQSAAALVRIENALVIDSRQLVNGDVRVLVDDGSGALELLLDRNAGIVSETPVQPGARVDATGLLVPAGAGKWQLKPRSTADFEARVPVITIAEARATTAGQLVALEGVALNAWATFGDGSIHLADATGTIRLFHSATAFIVAGDSIRVVGVTDVCCGQQIVSGFDLFNLGRASAAPAPVTVTTAEAAAAAGGTLDAGLVRVVGAAIDTIRTVASETHLEVDDGSGALTVILDRDAGISLAGAVAGDTLDIVGLLVPAEGSTWVLKPRTAADLQRH